MTKLFSRAKMRRLTGVKVTDEIQGEFISYDSRAEYYSVNNTAAGSSKAGSGRITAVIQPRVPTPNAAAAGAAPATPAPAAPATEP
jgi:lipopolysaccharide export system protein LptA